MCPIAQRIPIKCRIQNAAEARLAFLLHPGRCRLMACLLYFFFQFGHIVQAAEADRGAPDYTQLAWHPAASDAPVMARCVLDTVLNPEIIGGAGAPDRMYRMTVDRDGVLWTSSVMNGLWRYDGSHFDQLTGASGHASGLPTYRLDAAMTDRKGNLWVATVEHGLQFRPAGGRRFQTLSHGNPRFPHPRATRFFQNADRLYAMANIYGIVELDPAGGPAKTYAPARDPDLPMAHTVLKEAWHSDEGDSILYISTQYGLYAFNRRTKGFKHHVPEPPIPKAFDGLYSLNGFLEQGDTLWMGLWDNGLVGFDRQLERYVHVPLAQRNKDHRVNVVMSMARFGESWLLGTGDGLVVLNPEDWSYRLYRMPNPVDAPRMRDNWLTAGFPRGAYHVKVLADGHIYASTASGLRRVRPASLGLNALPHIQHEGPPGTLRWHALQAKDSTYSVFFLRDSTVLSQEGGRSLRLSFGAHFPDPHRVLRYQTRLSGLDSEWQEQGSQTSVQYTNLKGGWYRVDLRASYDGVDWSDPESLHFQVFVPIWKRSSVRLGSGLGMLALLMGAGQWWNQRSKKQARLQAAQEAEALNAKAEQDRKMAELEMQALRARMNPHFLFNSLNSIRLLVMKADNDAATDYLTRFSRLVRRILEHSGTERIRLSEEMEVLRLYAEVEGMRMPGQFIYRERLDPNLNPDNILVPPLLLQPYVENAIWHGLSRKPEPGLLELVVEAHSDGRSIVCRVLDDGIGREASRALRAGSPTPNKNRSMGMSITEERIALTKTLYGMDIEVDVLDRMDQNGRSAGTEVVLMLHDALLAKEERDQAQMPTQIADPDTHPGQ